MHIAIGVAAIVAGTWWISSGSALSPFWRGQGSSDQIGKVCLSWRTENHPIGLAICGALSSAWRLC